ncbi:MAG: DUF4136 domain-containing protein [Vicinamibacterales bacterium]
METLPTRLARAAAVAAVLFLAGCASVTVGSFAERGLDLRQYRTYAWAPGDGVTTGDPRLDNNRFFEDRVRAAVDRELARRGFEKTTADAPDLVVHYHASVAQEVAGGDIDPGYRYDDAAGRAYVYQAGTLFVDLVDPRTKSLVWRGWGEGSVDGVIDDQAVMEKRIDEAVADIMKRLPSAR